MFVHGVECSREAFPQNVVGIKSVVVAAPQKLYSITEWIRLKNVEGLPKQRTFEK